MKVLFLTMAKTDSLENRGIYFDLLRNFSEKNHEIYIVSPSENRFKSKTILHQEGKVSFLQVNSLKLQKTNKIEKGFGQLILEYQYLRAIKKHFGNVRFDLILYSTPPITFSKVVQFIKNKDGAFSYLLLKDIFPQNAVDLNMIKKDGTLHKIFRRKEKQLYELSDAIGCMSEANKRYILSHNNIDPKKIEVNPNTIEPIEFKNTRKGKEEIRKKYGLPLNKKIFAYGGNLGIPQGIDFLLRTIEEVREEDAHFLIVGTGTEYKKILRWSQKNNLPNLTLLSGLNKNDYDQLLSVCDIGLIFLHPNFTIPNFPSRLLSYLEMKMPVIAATDKATDIGSVVEMAGCGMWLESGDMSRMKKVIAEFVSMTETEMDILRTNAWNLLRREYLVNRSYSLIMEKLIPPVKTPVNGIRIEKQKEKIFEKIHFVD